MYSQPDDVGDNKPTKTVNYFVKEWVAMGHRVIVMHCPSKFPLILYKLPQIVKERFAGRISTMVPPIESRRNLVREENGAKVYRLPMLKMMPGQGYSKTSMQKQTKKIIKLLEEDSFKPDLVIGHFANPSLELAANTADHYKAMSSIVFHHDCNDANIQKYRIRDNIGRIGAIGARSIVEANDIKERLEMEKTPFVCCSGAPNDAVRAAQKICQKQDYTNGIQYIYVGSLIKRKHLDVVIRAFNNVCQEADALTVIGGGPEEESLKKLVEELNIGNKVIFTGRISREDVLHKMAGSHIFTLISDSEAYGMVYIEAMLQGCLTIASKGGGFDGIIRDGINGFICKPGDQEELEKVYKRISAMTEEERNKIGQAAIDTAIHYSEREVAERYLKDVKTFNREG
ncbi:MAG: glycosyltransferase family 4 protein [Firmicutes bacterium]|nr:glycosyltransferase family 4 protein [Bacillota bacterium]